MCCIAFVTSVLNHKSTSICVHVFQYPSGVCVSLSHSPRILQSFPHLSSIASILLVLLDLDLHHAVERRVEIPEARRSRAEADDQLPSWSSPDPPVEEVVLALGATLPHAHPLLHPTTLDVIVQRLFLASSDNTLAGALFRDAFEYWY